MSSHFSGYRAICLAVLPAGLFLAGCSTSSSPSSVATAPVVAINVTVNGNPTTRLGTATQFTAVVTGTSNPGVTWSVNGTTGGSATVGTITAAGLYTAPTALPGSGNVTIQATSVASTGVAGSLSETLLPPIPVITGATATESGYTLSYLLDVRGTGFLPSSVLQAGGTPLATTFLSATEIQATLLASAVQGSAVLTVVNPNPGGATSNASAVSFGANVTATVDITKPAAAIPAHFLGFSMDSNVVDAYVGTGTVADPILVNLIGNFTPYNGVPSLRPAAIPAVTGSSNISAKFLVALTALENATQAPLIVTIGSGSYNAAYAGNVASSVTGAVGSSHGLLFELGNEPDRYVPDGDRPSTWTFSNYLPEFQGYQTAVATSLPGRNAAGMASSSASWDQANDPAFLAAEAATLGVLTAHEYPLSVCLGTSSITVPHLLANSISSTYYTRYQPLVAAATPYGVPVRAGEMNSVSCGGLAGVSDTFASSLWLLDTLFTLQSAGVAGMNLHTGSVSASQPDQPYNAFMVSGTQVIVRPSYAGMLMFARAVQNSAALVPATSTADGSQNVKIWATLDANRQAHVTIIEKDTDTNTQLVSINLGPGATSIGKLESLITTSSLGVNATNQVYVGGQTFDGTPDGHPVGTETFQSVTPVNGIYTFAVPDGSAMTLTVQF